MKLSVIGSVKIDSRWRKKLFFWNLESLKPIYFLLSWRVNIVGRYASWAKNEILSSYKDAVVTTDDESSYYQVTKKQIEDSQNDVILFWEEDNWFLCPYSFLFSYLLSEFEKSSAESLTISHLTTSWKTKIVLPVVKENCFYKEYQVDKNSQKKVWEKFSNTYLTGISAIYKRNLAKDILEFNKNYLLNEKSARQFELDRKKGEEFLQDRGFIEMIPKFQVFREVFKRQETERVIAVKRAMEILKLREKGCF